MGEDHAQAKRVLRQELRAVRRTLPADEAARRSAQACERLARTGCFGTARHLVLYAPLDEEVDVTPVATAALREAKALYYPRVGPDGLEFLRADPGMLRPGHHGVPEPWEGEALAPGLRDTLFVVPGLAFDLRGIRLGRGAGHYDRALSRHPAALRVGIAFEFQIVPRLPADAWDVSMTAVVSDARLIGEAFVA